MKGVCSRVSECIIKLYNKINVPITNTNRSDPINVFIHSILHEDMYE